MLSRRTYLSVVAALALGGLCLFLLIPRHKVATASLPSQLTDSEFWRIVADFSEQSGFFRSDNFVSNETSFQNVIPELRRKTKPGGVYIGVGPDQNFTYVVALKPKLAFILDIRRQNMLLHLMYKALIEMSDDRAQFLSNLFSRPIPENLAEQPSPLDLLSAFGKVAPSDGLFKKNYAEVIDRLTNVHRFQLEPNDAPTIEYIYRAFFSAGPELRYSYPSQYGWRRFPTYAELMVETDLRGQRQSYLASEENFQTLKQLEMENRIVPLVGDFAGEKALRRLGGYLEDHGTTVSAFYTSNVEYYLFQSDDWRKFFKNVARLPLDADSTFIRAYFNNQRFQQPLSSVTPLTLLDSMTELLAAINHGQIRSYEDVIHRSP